MGTHRGHIFDTTVFLGDPRSNRWPIKRARFQGSKNQAEYQERTVDGRFSLPSCAPIIPDVAQNEAISRPRAIARFWLNCSTRKKKREEGGKGSVFHGKRRNLGISKRNGNGTGEGEGGVERLRSIPRKDGHWSIPRLSDGPTNDTRIYPPFLLPSSLLHTRDALNHGTSRTYNDRLPTFQSSSTCDTLPKKFSTIFPSLFFYPSFDKFGQNLRRPPRIPKRSRRNSLEREKKTSLSDPELGMFSLEQGKKKVSKLRWASPTPPRCIPARVRDRSRQSLDGINIPRGRDDPCTPSTPYLTWHDTNMSSGRGVGRCLWRLSRNKLIY